MMKCARRAGCTNPPDQPCLVCPYDYACPTCEQPPGSPCRRPSGHNCTPHVDRLLIADAVAIREHPDRVRDDLGESEFAKWQTCTGKVKVP